jgi:hypothetical protein
MIELYFRRKGHQRLHRTNETDCQLAACMTIWHLAKATPALTLQTVRAKHAQ